MEAEMSKTVLSVERQAELSAYQNALEASLLRVKEEKRSEEDKILPITGWLMPQQQTSNSQISLVLPSKEHKEECF